MKFSTNEWTIVPSCCSHNGMAIEPAAHLNLEPPRTGQELI